MKKWFILLALLLTLTACKNTVTETVVCEFEYEEPIIESVIEEPIPIVSEEPVEPEPEPEIVNLGIFKVTAYCSCKKCCGKWAINRPLDENGREIVYGASGAVLSAGRSVAVDPTVIPYGSTVIVNGVEYIAEDCGGSIKNNRLDIYFDDHHEALIWGIQECQVSVIYEED